MTDFRPIVVRSWPDVMQALAPLVTAEACLRPTEVIDNTPHGDFLDHHGAIWRAGNSPLCRQFSDLETYWHHCVEGRLSAIDYADLWSIALACSWGWAIPESTVTLHGAHVVFQDRANPLLTKFKRGLSGQQHPLAGVCVGVKSKESQLVATHGQTERELLSEDFLTAIKSGFNGIVSLEKPHDHGQVVHYFVTLSLWSLLVNTLVDSDRGTTPEDHIAFVPTMQIGSEAISRIRRKDQHPAEIDISGPKRYFPDSKSEVSSRFFLDHDFIPHGLAMALMRKRTRLLGYRILDAFPPLEQLSAFPILKEKLSRLEDFAAHALDECLNPNSHFLFVTEPAMSVAMLCLGLFLDLYIVKGQPTPVGQALAVAHREQRRLEWKRSEREIQADQWVLKIVEIMEQAVSDGVLLPGTETEQIAKLRHNWRGVVQEFMIGLYRWYG